MIEMEVREEEVDPLVLLRIEREAERPDPGARVENDQGVVVRAYLVARRVTAVPDGLRSRRRQRSSASPDACAHRLSRPLLLPEDRERADELVGAGEQRERGDGDVPLLSVEARDLERQVP